MRAVSIRRANAWLMIHTLRALEFLLPVWCLRIFFEPAAGIWAGWQLLRVKPTIRQFDCLPVSWRPRSRLVRIWRIWRQWTQVNVTKLLTYWPDRLTNPRWQRLGRCTDPAALKQMAAWERPVILAILHYGPVTVLHYWLRAHGLAAASLVANAEDHLSIYRRHKQMLSDRAAGLADVPHVFDLQQLRTACEFLQSRRFLIIAVDGGQGESRPVVGAEISLQIVTGTVRLAALTKAVVVPCLIRTDRSMAFTVHLGDPVPDAWVADRRQHPAACAHLLQAFLPILRAYPEQCNYELLFRLEISSSRPVD